MEHWSSIWDPAASIDSSRNSLSMSDMFEPEMAISMGRVKFAIGSSHTTSLGVLLGAWLGLIVGSLDGSGVG